MWPPSLTIMLNSLRTRLLLVYSGLVVLGFGGLTAWSANLVARSTLDDFGNTLQTQALFLASRLGEALEYNPQGATATIQETATAINGEVTLYASSGTVLASTGPSTLPLVSGTEYGSRRDEDGVIQIIASAPVMSDDDIEGYIQLNVPRSVPLTTIRQRQLTLWGIFTLFTGLSLGLTLWLVGTLTRPLADLRQTALNMAAGDLTQRVHAPAEDEIGEVGRAFNRMAEQVETTVANQRAFASNASHELRTPLTTIGLRTEMMLNDTLTEEESSIFIEEIDAEVGRMSSLVNDLLMLSRLDAQRLSAGSEKIDVTRLLSRLITADYGPKAKEKGINLAYAQAEQEILVTANLSHLETVFRNLIDNALKYTQPGGKIEIMLDTHDSVLKLVVTDNGEGIPPGDLPSIGDRFFRVDRARSRKIEGTGLGLALVKSILGLYNGHFDIFSEGLGTGTTVIVTWPQDAQQP